MLWPRCQMPDANWEDLRKHGVAVSFEEERTAPYNLSLMFRSSLDISHALCIRSLDIIANTAIPGPASRRTTDPRIRFRDGEQGGSAGEKEVRHDLGDSREQRSERVRIRSGVYLRWLPELYKLQRYSATMVYKDFAAVGFGSSLLAIGSPIVHSTILKGKYTRKGRLPTLA
jgi:hypothetical protein